MCLHNHVTIPDNTLYQLEIVIENVLAPVFMNWKSFEIGFGKSETLNNRLNMFSLPVYPSKHLCKPITFKILNTGAGLYCMFAQKDYDDAIESAVHIHQIL